MPNTARRTPSPHLPDVAFVALGGALGAMSRYGIELALPAGPGQWAWGTVVVNVGGCLAMGLLLGWVTLRKDTPARLTMFLATGFLGSLTTFSSYMSDTFELVDAHALGAGLQYVAATLVLGWIALRAGWLLGRRGYPRDVGRPVFGPAEMGD